MGKIDLMTFLVLRMDLGRGGAGTVQGLRDASKVDKACHVVSSG